MNGMKIYSLWLIEEKALRLILSWRNEERIHEHCQILDITCTF